MSLSRGDSDVIFVLRVRSQGANLQGVKMLCTNAEGASLKGCNFEDPAGLKANLEGKAVHVCETFFGNITFLGCNACHSDALTGANLKGVDMEGSQMTGINLRVATLKNAKLKNCNLRGATLAGTDLEVMFYFQNHLVFLLISLHIVKLEMSCISHSNI